MPKNQNGEVTCMNHETQVLTAFPKIAVIHMEDRPESGTNDGGNFKFDVYICPTCQYTEFYARPYNPEEGNNIASVQVKAEC